MLSKLVSIVLPTYNGSRYLEESIDSILSQTYKNWELIIVDDCSTDQTLEIARFYENLDQRIKVIHNNINMKLPNSLNRGFKESRGELLTWTSDDNMYLPTALETMVKALDSSEIYMVCADVQTINDEGNVIGSLLPYDEKTMLVRDSVGACFMYKRVVYTITGKYDDSLFCVEDYDYWIRVLKNFKHIKRIPQILYRYRLHDDTLTATQADRVIEMRTRIFDKYLNEILHDFSDQKEWLVKTYYDYVIANRLDDTIRKKFISAVPELKNEKSTFSGEDTYIIFGAGDYGHMAYDRIGKLTVCFADNNTKKQGKTIKGIPVYSVEEAARKFSESKIVISIGGLYTYDAIVQALKMHRNEFWTYFTLVHKEIV